MTTDRTLTATSTGPTILDLDMPTGQIHVTVTDTDRAEITLTTDAPADSPIGRAITAATITTHGQRATVRVPTTDQGGVTIQNGRGITVINGNGGIFVGGDMSGVVVTGRSVHISGSHVAVHTIPSITAQVRLPRSSALRVRTTTASVNTVGNLESVDFASKSGDLDVQECGTLHANSVSGDIRAEYADHVAARTVSGDMRLGRTETAELTSTSGDITISDFGGTARLTTVSGDITVHATEPGRVDASSTSGDINVTATAALAAGTGESALIVDASSRSGDVRTPRPPSVPTRPRSPRRF